MLSYRTIERRVGNSCAEMILRGEHMSLAAKLRDLRIRKNQSLQQLADAIGVSKTHIWELEKGRTTNPSIEMLTKLADHFEVTIRSLVGEDIVSDGNDENLMRMFRQVGQLDDSDKEVIDDMIQSMMRRRKARDEKN